MLGIAPHPGATCRHTVQYPKTYSGRVLTAVQLIAFMVG